MPDVDFTQPYFLGKSGVLLPLSPPSLVSRLSVFFGWAVVSSVLQFSRSALSPPPAHAQPPAP